MFQLKNVYTVVKEHIKKRKLLSAFLLFFVASVLLNILFPLPLQKENSKAVHAKDGTLLTAFLTADDKWRLPVHLDEISPQLIEAIIQKEDKWFYWHPGVNRCINNNDANSENACTGKKNIS
ncbi:MAG: transglycosylase domain-containing protein [Bacteroidetes bacterium]|nr:transglycosylase domain-containing protein [Bacteroidota bacterium]